MEWNMHPFGYSIFPTECRKKWKCSCIMYEDMACIRICIRRCISMHKHSRTRIHNLLLWMLERLVDWLIFSRPEGPYIYRLDAYIYIHIRIHIYIRLHIRLH